MNRQHRAMYRQGQVVEGYSSMTMTQKHTANIYNIL